MLAIINFRFLYLFLLPKNLEIIIGLYFRNYLWHDSPLWDIAFLRFPDNRIFMGLGCQPRAQPPTWRTRPPYLWPPETEWPSYTPKHWIPILVAFYDTYELRWDYSYPPVTTQRRPLLYKTIILPAYLLLRYVYYLSPCGMGRSISDPKRQQATKGWGKCTSRSFVIYTVLQICIRMIETMRLNLPGHVARILPMRYIQTLKLFIWIL
jgi:hypothetical protein